MFAINPFAALSSFIPPGVMQTYVVIMIFLVAAGTLFDIVHKGSAKYFFNNFRKSKGKPVGGGELVAIARQDRGGGRARLRRVLQRASAASRTCSPCTASSCTSSPPW